LKDYDKKMKLKTKEEIKNWLDKHGVHHYIINNDLTIDVEHNVNLSSKELAEIPVQFRKVKGYFDCSDNKLVSLEGSPKKAGMGFFCHKNKLISLKYCTQDTNYYFVCFDNYLSSLEFSPKMIRGNFDCSDNKLTSLEHCPKIISGNFDCSDNQITSLKYYPKVRKRFYCTGNLIKKFPKNFPFKNKFYGDFYETDTYPNLWDRFNSL